MGSVSHSSGFLPKGTPPYINPKGLFYVMNKFKLDKEKNMEHIIKTLSKTKTFQDLVLNNKGINYHLVRSELERHPTRLAKLNNEQYLKARDIHELTWGIINAVSGVEDDWE